ncbi:MAG: tetratricopeptide repeat protein [Planctomycetota bacterium]
MTSTADSVSWFEDDDLFVREVCRSLRSEATMPTIPGYVDLREIAQGGQGVVYSATQVSTRRLVAIKALREGFPEHSRAADRFRREVDLAATLDHPNIVAIFDSGLLTDGRPYLVMELVDGPTLEYASEFVDGRAVNFGSKHLDRALARFLEVCDGVAYAHRRGVVHRDLKPANVRMDADGRARILDFGLAKEMLPAAGSLELSQSLGGPSFIGSLPWASPEQAAGRNDQIDVRSDVYALGVILYQLLTGRFPYRVDGDLRTALEEIAFREPQSARKHLPTLPVDVDVILRKCLQKEPERRYQSTDEFARDLRRFLAGEAIDARRDSSWYLLRKTARRHARWFVAGGVALAALVGGLVVSIAFAKIAKDRERDALIQVARTQVALDYFAETFATVDPIAMGPDVKMVEVVRRAVEPLDSRFIDDADTKGFLMTKFIELLRNLGDLELAESLAEKAEAHATTVYGEFSPNALFAQANRALILHHRGRTAESVTILERAHSHLRAHPQSRTPETSHVYSNLATCLIAQNRIDEAEAVLEELLTLEVPDVKRQEQRAIGLEILASIRGYRGKYGEAIDLLRRALPLRQQTSGPFHTGTLRSRANLAYYLAEQGDVVQAEAITAELLAIERERFGEQHVETLSMLNNHANYLERLGRIDEAESEMRACYEGRLAKLGESHPHTMVTLGNLASINYARKEYSRAAELQRKTAEQMVKLHGPSHSDAVIARNNLAHYLDFAGQLEEATSLMATVVDDAAIAFGADHHLTAQFRGKYGAYLAKGGAHDRAEPELRAALLGLETTLGRADSSTAVVRAKLSTTLRALGRDAEAAALEEEVSPSTDTSATKGKSK